MPIDASIYSQFAPRVQSPMDVQNGLMQGASNALNMQHQRMQMEQMQADMADTNALRAAYRGGADPSTPEGRQALIQAAPLQAPKIFQQQADLAKTSADTGLANAHAGEFRASAAGKTLDAARSMLPMVKTPEQFGQWVDGLYQNPATAQLVTAQFGPPQGVHAGIAAAAQDPKTWNDYLQSNAMGLDEFIKNKTAIRGQDLTAQTSIANNTATNETSRSNNAATNATSRANNAATIGAENTRANATIQNQRLMAGMNTDGSTGDGVQARIQAIAEGRSAPPSEGSRAPQAQAILNGLHNQYPNVDLPALHQRVAAIKAFGEGKQGDQVRAFDALIGHTETLKDAALALKNNDIQALNLIGNKLGVAVGNNTAIGAFNLIKTAVGAEAASAVMKSNVGEGDRAKMLEPFTSNASPDQLIKAANTVQGLGAVQLNALERQYARTASIPGLPPAKFDDRFLSPAAMAVKAAHPDAGAPASGHPPEINDLLKKYGK